MTCLRVAHAYARLVKTHLRLLTTRCLRRWGTRRAILEQLRDGPKPVVEIARGLPVGRPAVSQHPKVLKEAGLVTDEAVGTRRVYQIDPQGLTALEDYARSFWSAALTRYGRAAGRARERGADEVRRMTRVPVDKEATQQGAIVVRESVLAELPLEHAFALFTEGINEWWPLEEGYSFGGDRAREVHLEPWVGGRLFERWVMETSSRRDGSSSVTGRIGSSSPGGTSTSGVNGGRKISPSDTPGAGPAFFKSSHRRVTWHSDLTSLDIRLGLSLLEHPSLAPTRQLPLSSSCRARDSNEAGTNTYTGPVGYGASIPSPFSRTGIPSLSRRPRASSPSRTDDVVRTLTNSSAMSTYPGTRINRT